MPESEVCPPKTTPVKDSLGSGNASSSSHPLSKEVNKVCGKRIDIFRKFLCSDADGLDCSSSGWNVFAQQDDMKIYNMELEDADGNCVDPLLASHTVPNVTAQEMCEVFWDVQYRLNWEISLDAAPTVLEVCDDNTVLLYQVYKRVWPATQRDSLFWSHIRRVDLKDVPRSQRKHPNDDIVLDNWMVCNYSTKYGEDQFPTSESSHVRLGVAVEMFCQTLWTQPAEMQEEVASLDPTQLSAVEFEEFVRSRVNRDAVRCRLLYSSQIDPGGWAPAILIRTMAKREYPRFLERISSFVIKHTTDKQPHF